MSRPYRTENIQLLAANLHQYETAEISPGNDNRLAELGQAQVYFPSMRPSLNEVQRALCTFHALPKAGPRSIAHFEQVSFTQFLIH
jgi:hypothetical protein